MVYIHNYGIVKQKLTLAGLLVIAGLFAFLATFGVFTNANAASVTNLTVTPTSTGVFDANNVVGAPGDAAPGFSYGSIASDGSGKTDMYFTPSVLFGREISLGEVASISYWTKTGATHTVSPADWFINIYTKPYSGDVSSASWYGDRIGTEPYYAVNLTDPANTWNNWTTGGATNQLRFFESTAGAPGANFGSYTDPVWADFITNNALSGQSYATRSVLFFSVQTGSATADGFTGKVDGLTISLTDGSVANVNFEADLPALINKDQCKNNGWQMYGFKNQGLCIQYVNTGKDSRVN